MAATPNDAIASRIQEQRNTRNKNLRGALFTSFIARGAGILLQVMSLPIAAAALGPHGFSIYSMVSATLAWLTLSNIGIGQATTLHIAREPEPLRHAELLATSWAVTTGISIFVVLLTTGLMVFTNIVPRMFSAYASNLDAIYYSLIFIGFIFFATQNLSVFEAAQLAYQRQDRLNIAISIGTTVAAVAVYVIAKNTPAVLSILIAVHIPVLVMRLVNAIGTMQLIRFRIHDLLSVRWKTMRLLLQDGISFLTGTAVSNFLCHPFSILAVGATATAMTSASFAAVMNAVILSSSMFGLVMSPIRAALPEAEQRADVAWIKRAYFLAIKVGFSYALIPCLLLSVFGQKIFEVWYRGSVMPQQISLIPAGIYVICLAIEVTNYNFLASLGRLKSASRWLLAKSIVAAFLTWMLAKGNHAEWVFWGLVITSIFLSLIPLSLMIFQLIKKISRRCHD